ncbi:2'-5' RNA ligase family protein [Terrabacter aeriphilus]|uniref:2'-5' RNA ligase family protein n=1 Tax=Terrabacter aeriphilus TaxID=515662 RepID=A0ABP9J374_9MICO
MPLQSVEALVDPVTDAAVRREWQLLAEAGLPSQASHQGDTNVPHVTLSAAVAVPAPVDDELGPALARALGDSPVTARLGPLVVLGGARLVLARLLVPSAGLLHLHAAVADAMAGATEVTAQVAVGRWVPHLTLARGLGAGQVERAVALLREAAHADGAHDGRDARDARDAREGAVVEVRRWDPGARRVWPVWAADGIPTMGS